MWVLPLCFIFWGVHESDSGDLKDFCNGVTGSKLEDVGTGMTGSGSDKTCFLFTITYTRTSSAKSYSWVDSSASSLILYGDNTSTSSWSILTATLIQHKQSKIYRHLLSLSQRLFHIPLNSEPSFEVQRALLQELRIKLNNNIKTTIYPSLDDSHPMLLKNMVYENSKWSGLSLSHYLVITYVNMSFCLPMASGGLLFSSLSRLYLWMIPLRESGPEVWLPDGQRSVCNRCKSNDVMHTLLNSTGYLYTRQVT